MEWGQGCWRPQIRKDDIIDINWRVLFILTHTSLAFFASSAETDVGWGGNLNIWWPVLSGILVPITILQVTIHNVGDVFFDFFCSRQRLVRVFRFPAVVQKHTLGEGGTSKVVWWPVASGIFVPKTIKICFITLRVTIDNVGDAFSETQRIWSKAHWYTSLSRSNGGGDVTRDDVIVQRFVVVWAEMELYAAVFHEHGLHVCGGAVVVGGRVGGRQTPQLPTTGATDRLRRHHLVSTMLMQLPSDAVARRWRHAPPQVTCLSQWRHWQRLHTHTQIYYIWPPGGWINMKHNINKNNIIIWRNYIS